MVVAVKMIRGVQIGLVMALSITSVKGILSVDGGWNSTLSKLSPVAIALNCQNQSTVIGQSENWLSSREQCVPNDDPETLA